MKLSEILFGALEAQYRERKCRSGVCESSSAFILRQPTFSLFGIFNLGSGRTGGRKRSMAMQAFMDPLSCLISKSNLFSGSSSESKESAWENGGF